MNRRAFYAALGAAVALLVAAMPAGAASSKGVIIENTNANPVPTTIVGTPTVNVDSSTPVAVRQVEQPYVARYSASNITGGGEVCTEIDVPDGMRLVLETVALDVFKNSELVGNPEAYVLMTLTRSDGSSSFDRPLAIPLTLQGGTVYAGHLRTRVLSGPVTVGTGNVILSLCAGNQTRVEGFVVGRLLAAG